MALLLVPRKVFLRYEVGLAELAHEWPRDDGPLREDAQVVTLDLVAGHIAALPRGGGRRLADPLLVPTCELVALKRATGHNLLVDGEAPQECLGPDAALEHQQVLVDPVVRFVCEPFHGVRGLLRLSDASCCDGIDLNLLHGLELGLLFRRKVFRFSRPPDFLSQLPLPDTAPGIFLRPAAEISHLLQDLLCLLRVSVHVLELYGHELGLLFRRKVFRFSRHPDFFRQLPLPDAAPGIFLRQAAEISHLLQDILCLLRAWVHVLELLCLLRVSLQVRELSSSTSCSSEG